MGLFVTKVSENSVVTHDGKHQLGYFNVSIEKFMSMSNGMHQEVYWLPDIVTDRYKPLNYQNHLKANRPCK